MKRQQHSFSRGSILPRAAHQPVQCLRIRALTYLAQRKDQGFKLGLDMASELGLPAQYLVKILQPLVTRGLLHSRRGRNGGFKLALAPQQVTLFEIVDGLEGVGRPR